MDVVNERSVAASTAELQEAERLGSERNYNRKLPWPEELDPDGVHILMPLPTNEGGDSAPPGWHAHADGKPAPPHIRCQAWIKVKGQQEAREGVLDVALELWPRPMEVIDAQRRGRRTMR
jgi:hypothetical protein